MSHWDKKLQKIIKDEDAKYKDVRGLYKKIVDYIHGNTNINTENTANDVTKICKEFQLDGSIVADINIQNRNKSEQVNSMSLMISIKIQGNFTGQILIETSPGYTMKNGERENIYYVSEYNCKVESDKIKKIKEYYLRFKDYNAETFIDLVLYKDKYVKYDSSFDSYEIWNNKPGTYEDNLNGNIRIHDEDRYYKNYYKMYRNLNKIIGLEDINTYARENLKYDKQRIEWYEYSL